MIIICESILITKVSIDCILVYSMKLKILLGINSILYILIFLFFVLKYVWNYQYKTNIFYCIYINIFLKEKQKLKTYI